MTQQLTRPSHLVCAAWGPLADRREHMDCPVIVRAPYEACDGAPARTATLPMVCACECHACKRAWWDQGRPLIREGLIIRSGLDAPPAGATCVHPRMRCPNGDSGCGNPCGHWWCPDCGLSWDDGAER